MIYFKGGIHPEDNKKFSKKCEIEDMPVPDRVIIPFSQHIGAPAKPLVSPGDKVKTADLIGDAAGFISSNIHSSVTGIVKSIKVFPHPVTGTGLAAEIETDINATQDIPSEETDIESISAADILTKIKDAGITGMGGASFPAHVKLSPPEDIKIDTLIINGAECEPYLTADYRLMLEEPDKIIGGINLINKALNCKNIYIGIENNKRDAFKIIEKHCEPFGIKPVLLRTKYPQGAEKQLIKSITGKEVPPNGLPLNVGIVVHNTGTAAAIYEAVKNNIPLIQRIVTVSGKGIKEPKNLRIRIGTLWSDIIDFCGGLKNNTKKIINGGPMMGIAQSTLNIPVIKGTSGILCLTEKEMPETYEYPCIRCGNCIRVCPMYLMPTEINRYAKTDNLEEIIKLNITDCMECGSCAYDCPSNIPLLHRIKQYKNIVLTYLKNKNEK